MRGRRRKRRGNPKGKYVRLDEPKKAKIEAYIIPAGTVCEVRSVDGSGPWRNHVTTKEITCHGHKWRNETHCGLVWWSWEVKVAAANLLRPGEKRKQVLDPACLRFAASIGKLKELAGEHGLTVKVNEVSCSGGQVIIYHVMFDSDGRRVLDYWPSTGRTYSPLTKEKSEVDDWLDAMDEAARIACGAERPAVAEMDAHLDAIGRQAVSDREMRERPGDMATVLRALAREVQDW